MSNNETNKKTSYLSYLLQYLDQVYLIIISLKFH